MTEAVVEPFAVMFLGCSGVYAGPGGACSGYLLRAGPTSVWLDCGPGTLGRVQEHVSLAGVDAVVVSHEHPDHCLELPVLRNALAHGRGQPPAIPVHTTRGTIDLVRGICHGDPAPLEMSAIGEGSVVEVGNLRCTFSRTDHPVETLAVRAETPAGVLAYTADTGPGWSLEALAPIDVALCEATLAPDEEGSAKHLSARQAASDARRAGARELIVTHLLPGSDTVRWRREAEDAFGGPVHMAEPGATFDIRSRP